MANLTGPLQGFGSPTSVYDTTPFPHTPGKKGTDNAGNEYRYVQFTGVIYYGCLVQIDSSWRAGPLLGTASRAYKVGVCMSGTPTCPFCFRNVCRGYQP